MSQLEKKLFDFTERKLSAELPPMLLLLPLMLFLHNIVAANFDS